jgi:hypothetical protein
MNIGYSWCGTTNTGSSHILTGQIVINIKSCPDAATYTSPTTYVLTLRVANPSYVY